MRIVFMGSPEFAANILESLHSTFGVVAAYSQPDKPVGRKQELTPPPVALKAKELNIELLQPLTFKNQNAVDELIALKPDVIIVAAYGQILPQVVLNIAPCINLHASLLPKHRGAAALQALLLDGEEYSGVTAISMTSKLDAGDILGFVYFKHPKMAKWDCLLKRLSFLGADLITSIISNSGVIAPMIQHECLATYAAKVSKSDGLVSFESANLLYRKFQAYHPWPGIFLDSGLKLFDIEEMDSNYTGNAGKILSIEKDSAIIECDSGLLKIKEVQAPSKKRISIIDYLRGARLGVGDYLV